MHSPAPFTMKLPVDRVTALAMDPGTTVRLSGLVTTSMDGTPIDAANLFDFAAGGLRVVNLDPAHHAYDLAASGLYVQACGAVGGCLVPRLADLAHARLRTEGEFASTLSGSIELESHPPPSATSAILGVLAWAALLIGAGIVLAWTVATFSRRAARSALGRIRIAARHALRATRGDVTLEGARRQIHALVDRARQLDEQRRRCGRKLSRIDRAALDRRAEACARTAVPVSAAALASFAAERDAVLELESDHGAALVELERIESVLRTATLRAHALPTLPSARPDARRHPRRGERCETVADPVDALVAELDLRDQAIAEADAT
ncbi:MAG TPA: hypothetical protein VK762_24260 [Polyangiaceae bacterium]|nr:hypothetical protein [Polyangiaceae bacterium]